MNKTKNPKLILISGLPASGKTILSKKIAERFALPVFGSDAIKEVMYDGLQWKGLAEKTLNDMGKTSFELLYYVLQSCLKSPIATVVEGNFHPDWNNERIKTMISENSAEVFYIYCSANKEAVEKRFKERAVSDSRHLGHRDAIKMHDKKFMQNLHEVNQPLEIGVDVFEFDTTDFGKVDHEKLFEKINNFLKK